MLCCPFFGTTTATDLAEPTDHQAWWEREEVVNIPKELVSTISELPMADYKRLWSHACSMYLLERQYNWSNLGLNALFKGTKGIQQIMANSLQTSSWVLAPVPHHLKWKWTWAAREIPFQYTKPYGDRGMFHHIMLVQVSLYRITIMWYYLLDDILLNFTSQHVTNNALWPGPMGPIPEAYRLFRNFTS